MDESESVFGKEFWLKLSRIILGAVLMVLGVFLLSEERVGLLWNAIVMALAWLILSYDIVLEAVHDIFKEHEFLDEELLMIIASLGAFALRFFGHNEFFEGVMVVLLFQIGELFEDVAEAKSKKAIIEASSLRANVAHRYLNGSIEDISPEELKIGDRLLIKAGELIPSDGLIVEGKGHLDLSSLTGESAPVHLGEGEQAYAGTTLTDGHLILEVNKEYADNAVSRIVRMAEESAEKKSKVTRFVDRFAKFYTPTVVLLALILAVVPPLILGMNEGNVWFTWIYRAISLLVIACPCSIIISVPLAYVAGMGLASRNGIVIKGAPIFDALVDLKLLVTDKTGTLTHGEFAVQAWHPIGITESEFKEFLSAAESRSSHPIARLLSNGKPYELTDFEERAGYGVSASYDGHKILAGNARLLTESGVRFEVVETLGSPIYLAVDGIYRGYVSIGDKTRDKSFDLIDGLHQNGIKVCLLSGDRKESVFKFAETIGIDEWEAELLPEGKLASLDRRIQQQKKGSVAYLGDGVNDAPSIMRADIGFAMGGIGSDLALGSADALIMDDDPSKLLKAYRISKIVRGQILFNIIFSLAAKVAVALCTILVPGFPLWAAILADTGLLMVLVLLSLLIMRRKA